MDNRERNTEQVREFLVEDTLSINKIFIADRKNNTITLQRKTNYWDVNSKYIARKDAIQTLLGTIKNIKIQRTVSNSQFERVIKNMSSSGVKVEIYTGMQTPFKTYTVGTSTPNHLGSYMLLEGDDEPFVLHLPGFNGYLAPRYGIQANAINERTWRTTNVFQIKASDISEISIKHIEDEEKSFSVKINTDKDIKVLNNSNKEVKYIDNNIYKLLNSFQELNCEAYKPSEKYKLELADPLHIMTVTHNNQTDTLRTFRMREKENRSKENNYTVERYYATLNDGDLMIIQLYVFNKVLITIDELQK